MYKNNIGVSGILKANIRIRQGNWPKSNRSNSRCCNQAPDSLDSNSSAHDKSVDDDWQQMLRQPLPQGTVRV